MYLKLKSFRQRNEKLLCIQRTGLEGDNIHELSDIS
jgi:hypothetical protein